MRNGMVRATALLIAFTACGPAPSLEDATLALETQDPRFEINLERPPSPAANAARELRLRLRPKTGWHMTPQAPTLLELSALPGVEFDAPLQHGEDAVVSSEERLEFAVVYRVTAERAPASSTAYIEGHLTFGVCRNDRPRCEIVHRELRIPLAL
jgi:hypothetical protein